MISKIIILLALILCMTGCSNSEPSGESSPTPAPTNEKVYSNEEVLNKALEIEEKYEINFYYGDDKTVIEREAPYMVTELENDNNKLMDALINIEKILERFPDSFLYETKYADELSSPYARPFEVFDVYLCSKLQIPDSDEDERMLVGKVAYYTYTEVYGCAILVDLRHSPDYKKTFVHELAHVIERRVSSIAIDKYIQNRAEEPTYYQWEKLNPPGYEYLDSRDNEDEIDKTKLPYTVNTEKDINNVYFVSDYANENSEEDLAETFAYLLSTDMDEDLPKAYSSTKVKKKVEVLIKMIEESYSRVDENAYWTKMYREKMCMEN